VGEVDGHDDGAGEINIFILTSDPAGTFRRLKPLLPPWALEREMKVAFRPVNDDTFTVLWHDCSKFALS
jgi:hypothetical protein